MFETTINIYRKLKQEEKSNTMREIAVTPMPSFLEIRYRGAKRRLPEGSQTNYIND